MRPFVKQAQNVPKIAPRLASPRIHLGIALGHTILKLANVSGFKTLFGALLSPKASNIELPDYQKVE